MTQLLPPKKEVALALLERSNVDVYLDPRARGVAVPPQFRKEPRLILKVGLNMPVPIPDLRVDEDSMSCTLSFNRSPFYCMVPWSSVFAMVGEDGRGMVWPDDVPRELAVTAVAPTDSSRSDAASPGSASSNGGSGGSGRRASRGSRLAEDTPSRPRGGSSGRATKKKASKKEEQARPLLVAVPTTRAADGDEGRPGEASDERRTRAAAADRPERRDNVSSVPAAPSPGVAPGSRIPPQAPSSPGRSESGRPKRELPPYLRVVK